MKVKFKKLHDYAVAPYQATPGSAGFDLTAISKKQVDGYHTQFGTGIAVEIPEGHVGLIFPRSSCYKSGMLLSNSCGVIDSDYRGEIKAVFLGTHIEKSYQVGDRIMQMIIIPVTSVEYEEAEELTETQRGTGGYGSTGR